MSEWYKITVEFLKSMSLFYEHRFILFVDGFNRRKLTGSTYMLKKMDEQILKRNFILD